MPLPSTTVWQCSPTGRRGHIALLCLTSKAQGCEEKSDRCGGKRGQMLIRGASQEKLTREAEQPLPSTGTSSWKYGRGGGRAKTRPLCEVPGRCNLIYTPWKGMVPALCAGLCPRECKQEGRGRASLGERKCFQPAALLLLAHVMMLTTKMSPCLQQAHFTPQGICFY